MDGWMGQGPREENGQLSVFCSSGVSDVNKVLKGQRNEKKYEQQTPASHSTAVVVFSG